MIVLGVDPGFRTLGLALVDTVAREVIDTATIDTGTSIPHRHKILHAEMRHFMSGNPMPQLVASEEPPFGFAGDRSGGKTACGLWFVTAAPAVWAAQNGVDFRFILPAKLKDYAGAIIKLRPSAWPCKGTKRTRAEKKWGIAEAVRTLIPGASCASDHEADAILAAFALAPQTH